MKSLTGGTMVNVTKRRFVYVEELVVGREGRIIGRGLQLRRPVAAHGLTRFASDQVPVR